jgi:hypothetical protein
MQTRSKVINKLFVRQFTGIEHRFENQLELPGLNAETKKTEGAGGTRKRMNLPEYRCKTSLGIWSVGQRAEIGNNLIDTRYQAASELLAQPGQLLLDILFF